MREKRKKEVLKERGERKRAKKRRDTREITGRGEWSRSPVQSGRRKVVVGAVKKCQSRSARQHVLLRFRAWDQATKFIGEFRAPWGCGNVAIIFDNGVTKITGRTPLS